MSATLDAREDDALIALRTFIAEVLDPAVEVIKGQDNRVGEPAADDYVVMTSMLRTRLSTNIVSFADIPGAGVRQARQATELTIQLDVHGPAASDNAQILATLLRDGFASERFAGYGRGVQPLYAGEPRQMPFINGEDQYEDRWTLDVAVQASPTVSVPQGFADLVSVALLPADAPAPPVPLPAQASSAPKPGVPFPASATTAAVLAAPE